MLRQLKQKGVRAMGRRMCKVDGVQVCEKCVGRVSIIRHVWRSWWSLIHDCML